MIDGIFTSIMILGCVIMIIRAKQKRNTEALLGWITSVVMFIAYCLKIKEIM